jgi:hypothetical protein
MLNFKDIIKESMGLTNRVTGELFTKYGENEPYYEFIGLSNFYDEGNPDHPLSGSPTAIKDPHIPETEKIEWIVQNKNKSMTTYAVVHFKTINTNEDVYFGKYFRKNTKSWDNTEKGYFSYKSKSSIKQKAKLQPSDILSRSTNLTTYDILKDVSELNLKQENPKLYNLLLEIANDTLQSGYPDNPNGYDVTGISSGEIVAITNYFCELLHPIAILKGNYDGNALEGVTSFFGKNIDYTNILIEFPTSKNQGLYDSVLLLDDKKLFISSKFGSSGQAAKPAASNLIQVYDQYSDKSMFDGFEKELKILKYIDTFSGKEGPILIANEILDLIDDEELKIIRSLEKIHNDTSIKNKTESYEEIKLTKNLQDLYDLIKTRDVEKDDKYIHLISGIAKEISNVVNTPKDNEKSSNFSKVASSILNGNTIQVYTKAKQKGNILYFDKFNTQWPDDSVTNILIDAKTRYRTNAITGKLGFVIKYRDNTEKTLLNEDPHHYNKSDRLDFTVSEWGIITYDGKVIDGNSTKNADGHDNLAIMSDLPDDFGSRFIIRVDKKTKETTLEISSYPPKINDRRNFSNLLTVIEKKLPLTDEISFEIGRGHIKGPYDQTLRKMKNLLQS